MLCAVNKTWAAVSYNDSTNICHMSEVPKVANVAGAESKVYVKLSFTDDIVEINDEG